MPQQRFPIDFDAIRVALCSAVMAATQLDQNHVIALEQERPGVLRPSNPYIAFKTLLAAGRYGEDVPELVYDALGNATTLYNFGGPRRMSMQFDCYGRSHEEAYGYMSLWQAALGTDPVQDILSSAGVAVARVGDVADMSILLDTAYEGRAQLECVFGIASNYTVDLGEIDSVQVNGTVTDGLSAIVVSTQNVQT